VGAGPVFLSYEDSLMRRFVPQVNPLEGRVSLSGLLDAPHTVTVQTASIGSDLWQGVKNAVQTLYNNIVNTFPSVP
jgi:hypothetical protein